MALSDKLLPITSGSQLNPEAVEELSNGKGDNEDE